MASSFHGSLSYGKTSVRLVNRGQVGNEEHAFENKENVKKIWREIIKWSLMWLNMFLYKQIGFSFKS